MTETVSTFLEPSSDEFLQVFLPEQVDSSTPVNDDSTHSNELIIGSWGLSDAIDRATRTERAPADHESLDDPHTVDANKEPEEEQHEPAALLTERTKSTAVLEYEDRARDLNSPTNTRLAQRAQAGDQAAMDVLYENTVPLIQGLINGSVALRTAIDNHQITRQECVQAGMIGAFQAIGKFDPHKGAALGTTIYTRARGAMMDELRALNAQHGATRTALQHLTTAKKDTSGAEMHELVKTSSFVDFPTSMYAQVNIGEEGQELTLLDEFSNEDHGYANIEFTISTLPAFLRAYKHLTEREQIIIGQDLDISPEDKQSNLELAERFGVSESRISQIRKSGLKKLQTHLAPFLGMRTKADEATAA